MEKVTAYGELSLPERKVGTSSQENEGVQKFLFKKLKNDNGILGDE